MKIKRSLGEKVFDSFNYFFLAVLALICAYPLWYVFVAALSDPLAIAKHTGALFWPIEFSFESIWLVLQHPDIMNGFVNSFKLLFFGTLWQLFCTLICGYVLSRRDFLLRRPIMLMITFTMFFGGGTIPAYLNLLDLGFGPKAGLISVILPASIGTYNMIIMRTAIEGMPESLTEAARIDGAGHFTIIWRLVLPLTKATIAVLALYYGVSHWNTWVMPSYLLGKKDQLLAVVIQKLLENTNTVDFTAENSEGIKYGAIFVTTVPILLLYPFVQKYFTKGVMIGAVKQ